MFRRAKIVATIGPASESAETIRSLIQAGMNVARLNFSHGTHAVHQRNLRRLRAVAKELGTNLTILQDLQGPKLRVGNIEKPGLSLQPGDVIRFSNIDTAQEKGVIPFKVDGFYDLDQLGKILLLDDGKIALRVISNDTGSLTAEVLRGGLLTSHKGVNLPGTNLGLSSLTPKDYADLRFGLNARVDAIAISFIRNAEDIRIAREFIAGIQKPANYRPLLIAKIEKPEAFDNLSEILALADGVMVARGDLAVETSIAKVPILQKEIIEMANRRNKLVITATQMLESMITAPTPTRAEATDIANAVLDGSDALMLSAETAVGQYPVNAVQTMSEIILETEKLGRSYQKHYAGNDLELNEDAQSLALAAAQLANDMNVNAIFIFTESGNTARLVSKTHTPVKIFAFTPNLHTYQQLALLWGVEAHYEKFSGSLDGMIKVIESFLERRGELATTNQVILVSGYPFGKRMPPNFLHLHTVQKKRPS